MSDLNDPRVFFAAERTLLAWNRTALALIGFGFVIERFGLFVRLQMLEGDSSPSAARISLWVGIAFIVVGSVVALVAVREYRRLLTTLKPVEIPDGYQVNLAVYANVAVAVLGLLLAVFLIQGI